MLSKMLSRRELLALTPKIPLMLNGVRDDQVVKLEQLESQIENLLCDVDGLTNTMVSLIEVVKVMEERQNEIISTSNSNAELFQAEIARLKGMIGSPYVGGTREVQSQS